MAAAGVMMQPERSRLLDAFYLVGAALLVCLIGVGAFVLADIYHVNPLWVFFGLASVGIFVGAREDYREQFRSPRFVAFVCGWAVINIGVIMVCVSLFGWLWLIPALLLEQFLFYMSAYWFFGVDPPSRRRWPFQRDLPKLCPTLKDNVSEPRAQFRLERCGTSSSFSRLLRDVDVRC